MSMTFGMMHTKHRHDILFFVVYALSFFPNKNVEYWYNVQ